MVKDNLGMQIFQLFVVVIILGSIFAGVIYWFLQIISGLLILFTVISLIATIIVGFILFNEEEEKFSLLFVGLVVMTLIFGFFAVTTYQFSHTSEAETKILEFQKEFAPLFIVFELRDPEQLVIAELEGPVKEAVINMCEQSSLENCRELTQLIETEKIALETIPDAYSKGIKLEELLKTVEVK